MSSRYDWDSIYSLYVSICAVSPMPLEQMVWEMPILQSASIQLAAAKYKFGDKDIGFKNLESRQAAEGKTVTDLFALYNKKEK